MQRAFELHEDDEAAHSLTSKNMKWDKHKNQIISGKNSVWRTPDTLCFSTEKSLNLDNHHNHWNETSPTMMMVILQRSRGRDLAASSHCFLRQEISLHVTFLYPARDYLLVQYGSWMGVVVAIIYFSFRQSFESHSIYEKWITDLGKFDRHPRIPTCKCSDKNQSCCYKWQGRNTGDKTRCIRQHLPKKT